MNELAYVGNGKKVALVLGSGGARGYAHIGVIEALEARGFVQISLQFSVYAVL